MAKQKYWNGIDWEVVGTDAEKVSLKDTSNKFTATDVEGAMLELFTFANNGKTDIATVIGSPATTSDTFATLKGRVQTNKTNLATNLTNKNVSAAGNETLAALVAKVANIATGKKYATGSTSAITTGTFPFTYVDGASTNMGAKFTVSGLSFRPTLIYIFALDGTTNTDILIYNELNGSSERYPKSLKLISGIGNGVHNPTSFHMKGDVGTNIVGSNYFTFVCSSGRTYYWVAIE